MTTWNIGTFLAIAVVSVIELVLCRKLNKSYFLFGVPIFRQELWAHSPNAKPPSAQFMENRVGRSAFSRLEFQELDSNTLGFDDVSSEGSIFHGLLRFSPMGARIEVTGFVAWYVPLTLVIICVKFLELHAPLLVLGITGVFALLGMHHIQRCRQVAIFALQQWNS